MLYLALWASTTLALLAWLTASSRVRRAREAAFIFGFTAGMESAFETVKAEGQLVDPVHRAAQLRNAKWQ